ncbi:UDP-2,4-diacetamido-2,4,6-trideoxy-beta-L-altropyranose hydrolase [Thiomicrorhabdus hydrogeniphila]
MRCLTLANALKIQDAQVEFICREHCGHLIDYIKENGFNVHSLPIVNETKKKHFTRPGKSEKSLFHSAWLGVSQQQDAAECLTILDKIKPNWLIVDHYAIDQQWQSELKPYYQKLMVIDDLGDRQHLCDILLDQTYGDTSEKYEGLVPQNSTLLIGCEYALLRPEFSQWRELSLKHQAQMNLNHLLITLGGIDADNVTSSVLLALKTCNLPEKLKITVVMGANAPHLQAVTELSEQMSCELNIKVNVKVNVANMAELMANTDLAIGGSGSTSWERCCLGLPTLVIVLAENQKGIAKNLKKAGAVKVLETHEFDKFCTSFEDLIQNRQAITLASSNIVDGQGVARVIEKLQ